jgi:hypothetical protein
LDVLGAVTDPLYQGTFANGITPEAAVSGYYIDGTGSHGFLRARNGTFTPFDLPFPGAYYPNPSAINPAGEIAGYYFDAIGTHGFLRIPARQDESYRGAATKPVVAGIDSVDR